MRFLQSNPKDKADPGIFFELPQDKLIRISSAKGETLVFFGEERQVGGETRALDACASGCGGLCYVPVCASVCEWHNAK